jgi:hypothetical protein
MRCLHEFSKLEVVFSELITWNLLNFSRLMSHSYSSVHLKSSSLCMQHRSMESWRLYWL